MPLVGHLVRDMLTRIPNHIHRDDLTSAGLHALVTAARGWDPDRGIPFHRFATHPHPRRHPRRAALAGLGDPLGAHQGPGHRHHPAEPDHHAGPHADRTRSWPRRSAPPRRTCTRPTTTCSAPPCCRCRASPPAAPTTWSPSATPGPEDMLLRREQIGYLHHAIASLPERLQIVDHRVLPQRAADGGHRRRPGRDREPDQPAARRGAVAAQGRPEHAPRPGPGAEARTTRRASPPAAGPRYYATIAGNTNLHSRLALTNAHGLTPLPSAPPPDRTHRQERAACRIARAPPSRAVSRPGRVEHLGQVGGVQHAEPAGRPGDRDVEVAEAARALGDDLVRLDHDHASRTPGPWPAGRSSARPG